MKYITNIDYEKLYQTIRRRGLYVTEVSKQIGLDGSYISKCKTSGKIQQPAFIALCTLLDINGEDYMVKEPEVAEEVKERVQVFDVDQVVEELKALNGYAHAMLEAWLALTDQACRIEKEMAGVEKDICTIKHILEG